MFIAKLCCDLSRWARPLSTQVTTKNVNQIIDHICRNNQRQETSFILNNVKTNIWYQKKKDFLFNFCDFLLNGYFRMHINLNNLFVALNYHPYQQIRNTYHNIILNCVLKYPFQQQKSPHKSQEFLKKDWREKLVILKKINGEENIFNGIIL